MSTALLALVLSPSAQAFCGTYMGSAGAELYNSASQVVVVREGKQTTLTLANDYQGDLSEFALVVPVPEVLGKDDVGIIDPSLVETLDSYSAPRRVSYTCADFYSGGDDGGASDGGASDGGGSSADGSVTVEAEFAVGEYSIVMLSAKESAGLLDWLGSHGYALPDGAEELLGEYIEAGAYFLAAQVALDELPEEQTWLSPLRISYASDVFSLPIRLGTLNANGAQDLLIYAINDLALGQVGISNYPEATVEDDCMWPEGSMDFGDFYASTFQAAASSDDEPSWVMEYGWSGGNCDPCTDELPDDTSLAELGWEHGQSSLYFTRLHLRYEPHQADQDLVLYHSNLTGSSQERFIDYLYELEDRFPVCGEGMVEDPGSCDDGDGGSSEGDGGASSGDGADDDGGGSGDGGGDGDGEDPKGCSTVPGSPLVGGLLVLVAAVGLRRRW